MDEELTIQQAAGQTGLSLHTLRYYERIGLIPPIRRAPNGHRRYSEQDVGWIVFLTCMRSTGMPISEIKRYGDLLQQGDSTTAERLAVLESYRSAMQKQLQELGENLATIESKIKHYQEYYKEQLKQGTDSET